MNDHNLQYSTVVSATTSRPFFAKMPTSFSLEGPPSNFYLYEYTGRESSLVKGNLVVIDTITKAVVQEVSIIVQTVNINL